MKNPYQQMYEQYKTIELQTCVDTATPHELINLLLQGARSHIASALGNIQRKEIKDKGEHIGKALSIIECLKISLNQDAGGQIADNLLKLYDYIEVILLKANLNNDESLLTQANQLISEIHQAWQTMKVDEPSAL